MVQLIRTDLEIDFLGKSKPFVWLSTLVAVASIALLATKGLNYGIDFTGGAEVHVAVPASWDTAKLRSVLTAGENPLVDPAIVQVGELTPTAERVEYLIKVQMEDESKLNQVSAQVETLLKASPEASFELKRVDVVGPAAGANLRNSAFLSILYATLFIVIYITLRFDMRYAPGVLRALAIDVITTLGIWVLLGYEFNLTVVASLLTIAGYSCNDTIVIYDRIRDYTKSHPDWPLRRAINKSINLNLGRTVLTTLATLFVVVSLFFLGGPVLRDFSLPLLIGFTTAVFSTIFVANPMILYMEERRQAKEREASLKPAKPKKPTSRYAT